MVEITTVSLRERANESDRYGEVGNAEWLRGAADSIDMLCKQIDGSVRVAAGALAEVETLRAALSGTTEALAKSRAHLGFIATHLTTDEGDKDDTEEDIGLEMSEVVEMAHDNLIGRARYACDEIDKFFSAHDHAIAGAMTLEEPKT